MKNSLKMSNENTEHCSDQQPELDIDKTELIDFHEKYLRLQADMENYRKRLDRNLAKNVRQRKAELLSGFLPVLDNLTRALEAGDSSVSRDGFLEGVKLIADQFASVLENHGVSRIPVSGSFDPRLHDVIATVQRDDLDEGSIIDELVAGYLLDGEVLRARSVRVSTLSEPVISSAEPDVVGNDPLPGANS